MKHKKELRYPPLTYFSHLARNDKVNAGEFCHREDDKQEALPYVPVHNSRVVDFRQVLGYDGVEWHDGEHQRDWETNARGGGARVDKVCESAESDEDEHR